MTANSHQTYYDIGYRYVMCFELLIFILLRTNRKIKPYTKLKCTYLHRRYSSAVKISLYSPPFPLLVRLLPRRICASPFRIPRERYLPELHRIVAPRFHVGRVPCTGVYTVYGKKQPQAVSGPRRCQQCASRVIVVSLMYSMRPNRSRRVYRVSHRSLPPHPLTTNIPRQRNNFLKLN